MTQFLGEHIEKNIEQIRLNRPRRRRIRIEMPKERMRQPTNRLIAVVQQIETKELFEFVFLNHPGHSSVTGTSRNDFFPGCFLASGFLSGKNRRIPIGSYRFQKGPAGDRLENYRNCPKTSDRNPAAKNQSKTARKRSEAAKTGGIRHGNRRNRPAFRGSGNWIDRPGSINSR